MTAVPCIQQFSRENCCHTAVFCENPKNGGGELQQKLSSATSPQAPGLLNCKRLLIHKFWAKRHVLKHYLYVLARLNAQLKNFLDSNMRPPPSVGDFLEFVHLMVNPPHGAAEAYIHDPIFGKTFDGVQLSGNDGSWAKPVLSATKLMLEFQVIVGLMKYVVQEDDLCDTEEQKAGCVELRKQLYPPNRCPLRISTWINTYINVLCCIYERHANGGSLDAMDRHCFPQRAAFLAHVITRSQQLESVRREREEDNAQRKIHRRMRSQSFR